MTIKVNLPAKLRSKFRRWARDHYPNEILTYMLGTWDDRTTFTVCHLTHPSVGDRRNVETTPTEAGLIRQMSEQNNWQGLGTIHTHVDTQDTGPSCTDILSASGDEAVYGICAVWRDGEKMKTKIQFFPAGPKVEVISI